MVQGLFAFVLTAADSGAALTTDGVDFVDEEDRGSVFARLREKIAHATRANADEHLNEFRAVDREEGNARFPGDRARQKRFTRAWRAKEQRSARHARAHSFVFFRILQEIDDFDELRFHLIHTRDVGEGRALSTLRIVLLRKTARLSEVEGVARASNRAENKEEEENRHADRNGGEPPGIVALRNGRVGLEFLAQFLIDGRIRKRERGRFARISLEEDLAERFARLFIDHLHRVAQLETSCSERLQLPTLFDGIAQAKVVDQITLNHLDALVARVSSLFDGEIDLFRLFIDERKNDLLVLGGGIGLLNVEFRLLAIGVEFFV